MEQAPQAAIRTQNLTFAYPKGRTFHFPDIEAHKGNPLLVLGPSGTGKTTFLHVIAGFLSPSSGLVTVNKHPLSNLPASTRDKIRGQEMGIVFQRSHFVAALTVRENLRLALQLARKPQNDNRILQLLESLSVGHTLHKKPHKLSVGEQQRVAIARGFIHAPKVLLADEPTSALDDANTTQVIQLLETQAAAAGTALIIVTHDNRLTRHYDNQVVL